MYKTVFSTTDFNFPYCFHFLYSLPSIGCGILSIVLSLIGADDHDRPTAWVDGFAILMAVAIVVLVTAINDYTKEQQFRDLQKKLESTSK